MMRIHLRMAGLNYPIIIIPEKTGIIYENQTRGYACNPRELEGYLIPLPYANPNKYSFCNEDKWRLISFVPIDILRQFPINLKEKVNLTNRDKIKVEQAVDWNKEVINSIHKFGEDFNINIKVKEDVENEEAWYNVYYDGTPSILTWRNSD